MRRAKRSLAKHPSLTTHSGSRVEVSAGRKLEPANANFNRKVMDFAVETTERSGNVLNSFCPAAANPQRWDQMQS
jgi:hypothetical protein